MSSVKCLAIFFFLQCATKAARNALTSLTPGIGTCRVDHSKHWSVFYLWASKSEPMGVVACAKSSFIGWNVAQPHTENGFWAPFQYPTSYCKISRSLEAARFVFKIVRGLWNLTWTSAALLPMCLSSFKAMRSFKLPTSRRREISPKDVLSDWNGVLVRHGLESCNFVVLIGCLLVMRWGLE